MSFPTLRQERHLRSPRATGQHQWLQLRGWVVACLLALALLQVLMPALGLMHRVVHDHAPAALAGAPSQLQADVGGAQFATRLAWGHADASAGAGAGDALATSENGDSQSLAQRLFDGHASADCQLLDHLLLGVGVLPVLLAWMAPAPLMRTLWSVQALLLRKSAALFQARAPPLEPGV